MPHQLQPTLNGLMPDKYTLFRIGFTAIAAIRADRWLRPLAQGTGLILMLHHVRPPPVSAFTPNRLLEITPDFLNFALKELHDEGFEIIPLDDVPRRLISGRGGRPFACLTFDDGYRDNVEHAWPILKRHGAPWTLFVTTDFADGRGQLWWLELEQAIARLSEVFVRLPDATVRLPARTASEKQLAFETLFTTLRAGPEERLREVIADLAERADVHAAELASALCLTWYELQELARAPDVTIGAHTLTHPMLAKQDITSARREIVESKAILEQRLARPVRHFAYPGGDTRCAGPREFGLAKQAGFLTALTSRPGHLFGDHAEQLHALPRVSVNGLFQNRRVFRALLSGVPFLAWNRTRVVPLEHG